MPADRAVAVSRTASAASESGDLFTELFASRFAETTRLAGLMGADDPENVAQEAFARLHSRMNKFNDAHEATAYLRATVCNLSRSRLRHLKVARRTAPMLASSDVGVDPASSVSDTDQVLGALRQLPGRQRQVIVLRYWLGLPERDIAETLHISAGSVKAHSHRAMTTLNQLLTQQQQDNNGDGPTGATNSREH